MSSKYVLTINFLSESELIFAWFHLFLSNTNTQFKVKTVLFQTIQFSMSTKLNGSKYCYVPLTIQLKISHVLNDQTVLFQTI